MMRRLIISFAATALLLASTGCIAVSSKNNRFASDSDVVAVDGRVYVVNKRTGSVRAVDLCTARPLEMDELREADSDD